MKKLVFILLAILLLMIPLRTPADGLNGTKIYTVHAEQGEALFRLAGEIEEGDEYISGDNLRYTIESVDETAMTAQATYQGMQKMPDVNWLEASAAVVVSNMSDSDNRLIALYATHSDESYKPSDGTESAESGHGGIFDVCEALKTALEEKGIKVVLDETNHVPHDAGAYRRSRQTAIELLKQGPDALIDVHRDGIPDPDEYNLQIDGEDASKIRLLVGRSNQNAAANKEFALELKAVADKLYPHLVKDIFIGKGTYNQDLMSNSILLEFGTHTLDKDRAIASTRLMSNVISDTLYGGVSGAAKDGEQGKANQGAGTGLIWMIIAVVVGIGVFAILQTGRGKDAWNKVKRTTSELTLGTIGKRKE